MIENQKYRSIVEDCEKLASNRANFNSQWSEIAEVCDPSSKGLFQGNTSQGEKRNQSVLDSTPIISLQRFGAILDSLLTPRNQKWHKIQPSNDYLLRDRETRLYFEQANNILFKLRYAPIANFQSQNQKDYISLGAYGTSCMFTDELRGGVVGFRYKSIHLSEFYFTENHQGIPDKVYRKFKMSVRQMKQRWENKLPDKIKEMKDTSKEYEVVHIVQPNEDMDRNRADYKGMPFYSCYVLVEGALALEEGGFTSFPYAVSRYEQSPIELYGRSPAMSALPAIKTLNEQKKTVLKQGHRTVDPILLFADDGILDGFSLKAGAMNVGGISAEGKELVKALPIGRVDVGREMMEDEKNTIKDAFLVSIFQILTENPQMTATEVMERTREKGILLAPTVGRQHTEKLGPMIERELDLASKLGLLPPMPQALIEARGEYRIEYDSPISRAQRSEEAAGVMRSVQSALEIVNVTQNPEPLDHFNWDSIIPEVSDINGTPLRWMRSLEDVQRIREGRAQAQQQQQMIDAAPAAAGIIKTMQK